MNKEHFLELSLLAGASFTGIAGVNVIENKFAVRNHRLESEENNYYQWKNFKIYYTKKGFGKPIILLHDLKPDASSYEWSEIIDKLAETHRVYAFDLLGCGRSDKPEITYTNFYYVQILLSFIKTQICEKTFVISSGYSSVTALMAGAYDPSKFSGIAFINPPSIGSMARIPNWHTIFAMRMMQIPVFGDLIYNVHYGRAAIDNRFSEELLYNPFRVSTELIETYLEAAHLGNGKGRFLEASLAGRYLNINITHALKSLKVPAWILVGEELRNETAIAKSWADIARSLGIRTVSQSKNYPHYEKPKETVSYLQAILSENENNKRK